MPDLDLPLNNAHLTFSQDGRAHFQTSHTYESGKDIDTRTQKKGINLWKQDTTSGWNSVWHSICKFFSVDVLGKAVAYTDRQSGATYVINIKSITDYALKNALVKVPPSGNDRWISHLMTNVLLHNTLSIQPPPITAPVREQRPSQRDPAATKIDAAAQTFLLQPQQSSSSSSAAATTAEIAKQQLQPAPPTTEEALEKLKRTSQELSTDAAVTFKKKTPPPPPSMDDVARLNAYQEGMSEEDAIAAATALSLRQKVPSSKRAVLNETRVAEDAPIYLLQADGQLDPLATIAASLAVYASGTKRNDVFSH